MSGIPALVTVAVAMAVAARGETLPTVQPWQRCACAVGESPSLTDATTQDIPNTFATSYQPYMDNLEAIFETQCDLVDRLRCFESNTLEENEEVDYVVVGAGTAGALVAGRLAEDPSVRVAVLEAGGPEPSAAQVPGTYFSYMHTPIDWDYELEPQKEAFLGAPNGRGRWPRGKVIGGTGVLHGMMYQRGNAWDYDQWETMGNKGWAFRDVLPFFKRTEDNRQIGSYAEAEFHSEGGPMTVEQFHSHPPLADAVLEGARQLGFRAPADLSGANQTGFTLAQATTRDGVRLSLAKVFLQPKAHQRNLRISMHSLATRVLMEGLVRRAVGVEYERDGQRYVVRARKEVVLCAGAVATPQLLLLSGIGPKEDLQALGISAVVDSPHVGDYLYNHVSFTLKFSLTNTSAAHQMLTNSTVMTFLDERQGPLTSTGLSQMTGFVSSGVDGGETPADVPDLQIFFAGYLANLSRSGSDDEVPHSGPVQRFEITPTLLRPSSYGRLTLRSADPSVAPRINANYLTEQRDMAVLIAGVRFSLRLAATEPLRALGATLDETPTPGCESIAFGSDAYWECAIRHATNPENHQVGTASMGPVLDERLRVRGVRSLRVADAAAMPRVPGGNVNAPIIMLAEKAAQMLKDDAAATPTLPWGLWDLLRSLRRRT